MTVTEFSRNLSSAFDRIEHKNEGIILTRNNHTIARIIPGSSRMNALEAMTDLYGIIDDTAGKEWEKESRFSGNTDGVKNPWDS
jgi:antitoxin (DNA-binding transcriptional repressor) of toxin-antitoxin stability system